MAGVGLPGGPGHKGGRHIANKAKQSEYRHSEKGRMARKMRMMDPEVKAKMRMHRNMKRKMKRGF